MTTYEETRSIEFVFVMITVQAFICQNCLSTFVPTSVCKITTILVKSHPSSYSIVHCADGGGDPGVSFYFHEYFLE